jgi:hypothetical protein
MALLYCRSSPTLLRKVGVGLASRTITVLDALNTEQCQIVTEMSADRLLQHTPQLSRELRDLEGRARKLTAELHQETYPASSEIASMKQDIEQLRASNNATRDRFYFD